MSEEYVIGKVKEALKSADGNRAEAQRMLLAAAMRDHDLLLGLSKPHLKAITNYAIEYVMRVGDLPASAASEPAQPITSEMLEKLISRAGVQVRAGDLPPQSGNLPKLDPDRQASTWQTIVKAFKKK